MITAQISNGYIVFQDVAYPIEITNLDAEQPALVNLSGANTVFTYNSITVAPLATITIYASTTGNDSISIVSNSNTVLLDVQTQINDEVEYGTQSYITILELPPDQAPLPPNKFASKGGKVVRRGNQILIQLAIQSEG